MDIVIENEIVSFKDLKVWQEGILLVKEIYHLCQSLPKEESLGLSSQLKRSALSIPSNIAEGHSRQHRSEYRQFVYIALGSLAELETQIHIAGELKFMSAEALKSISERVEYLRAMLLNLGRKL